MKYDVFHFHSAHTLLPRNLDLAYLKLLNKKLVFEFHGTDIRQKKIASRINPLINEIKFDDENYIVKRAENIYKYADSIILHDDELIPEIKRKDLINVVPLRIDLSKFIPTYPDANNGSINIVHAPSNRRNKGTEYIITAISSLREKYSNINFILLENVPQDVAIKYYLNADIIIDQVLCGFYGVLSLEAMALGKPVITYVTDYLKERLPEELPIVSASPYSLNQELETLINNADLRKALGINGRKYVEKYHDCNKNSQVLWDIYNHESDYLIGREAFKRVSAKNR